jgi:hypothetical protein
MQAPTCTRSYKHGIDGYGYLRRLLIELPKAETADDYEALLPWSIGIAAN